jgi:hypothetical protein
LEWVKPYKEIAILAIAIVAAVSGSVAWAVAHFATQAELFYTECRINNNMETRAFGDKADAFAAQIHIRSSQIQMLTEQFAAANQIRNSPTQTEQTASSLSASIKRLSDEITTLTKEQNNHSIESKKKIDANASDCIKEAPPRSLGKK